MGTIDKLVTLDKQISHIVKIANYALGNDELNEEIRKQSCIKETRLLKFFVMQATKISAHENLRGNKQSCQIDKENFDTKQNNIKPHRITLASN